MRDIRKAERPAGAHKRGVAAGHISGASGLMRGIRLNVQPCPPLMRGRGTSDKRSGDAINGGTPPGVSDLADLPDGVPDKRGGDLLSHPFGQYHRRGRA